MRWTIRHITFAFISFFMMSMTCHAQKESSDVRRGNSAYEDKHYTQAEIDYRRGRSLKEGKGDFKWHQ